ncbi:MAG: hypothetical protein ABIA63_06975 [bacterium]
MDDILGFELKEDDENIRIIIKGKCFHFADINSMVSFIDNTVQKMENRNLIIDLTHCVKISSAFAGFIFKWSNAIKDKHIILVNAPDLFIDLLKVCDLDSTIKIKREKVLN